LRQHRARHRKDTNSKKAAKKNEKPNNILEKRGQIKRGAKLPIKGDDERKMTQSRKERETWQATSREGN